MFQNKKSLFTRILAVTISVIFIATNTSPSFAYNLSGANLKQNNLVNTQNIATAHGPSVAGDITVEVEMDWVPEGDIEVTPELIDTILELQAVSSASKKYRKPIIGGNLKREFESTDEIKRLFDEIEAQLKEGSISPDEIDVFIAPQQLHLGYAQRRLDALERRIGKEMKGLIKLGTQGVSVTNVRGAYTESLATAEQLKNMGADFIIVGHSEARHGDPKVADRVRQKVSNEQVNMQVKTLLEEGIIPVLAVGETLDQRQEGSEYNVIAKQLLESLDGLTSEDILDSGLVIAYEPIWAIGTGVTATPRQADQMQGFIRALLLYAYGQEAAEKVRIQYGGSMKPANVAKFSRLNNVDGGLIGGAAKAGGTFIPLLREFVERKRAKKIESNEASLRNIVSRMVPENGGIMAADESVGSAANRLNMVNMENTPGNRQRMRQLMLTVERQREAGISAVILDQDTYGNVDQDGNNLIDTHVIGKGKVAGIKTDKKLIDDPDSPGEKVPNPEGLEALPEMLRAHKAMGAEFTKWRTVHYIDVEKDFPSEENIRKNAIVQAKQAKMTQEAGMVPIVEPEVILDGDHSIEDSYKATVRVLQIVFEELENEGVYLPGMILKTSMILSGNKAANRASHEEVGFETLVGLLKSVPSETGAIVFLSGGQGDDEVNENLNAVSLARMNRFEEARERAASELLAEGNIEGAQKLHFLNETPWEPSYSFGRGLQRKALLASGEGMENFEAGQEAQLQSALQTQAARIGKLHPQREVERAALRNIVSRMVPVDGGILAADESVGSAANRLNMVGMENTAENREKMRQLMLTVERQREAGISAVILDQDTYGNVDQDGNNLIDTHVIGKGKVAGIKTDKKIIDDPDSPGEKIPNPEGLEALPEMLAVHKAMGAEFTKWRTVHYIDPERDFPTEANIRKNAIVQAKQAKMTQDAGMVPIVEPEVILDGDHSIEDSYKATIRVLQIVFEELANEGVYLPGMILKTSMILSGNKADNRASHEEVGFETLVGLLKSVPSETGAIVFLSGGQGDDEVNENLNEISLARLNRFEEARERAASELAIEGNIVGAQKLNRLNEAPWEVSYSFGRGLQRPALKKAGRNMRNFKAGQQVQLQSALTTQAARLGELHPQREVDREALRSIVTRMVPADGGIMAADESVGSAANRLNMVGMENTAENREKMRQLMLTVPGQVHAGITAVILDQDTYGNVDQEGRNLIDTHVIAEGKVAGIKTDKKLIDDPDSPGEKVPNPEGLEALPEMLRAHKAMGAEFTKWRTVHYIDVEKDFPSEENIRKNAIVQAKQAKMTQEAGMVPIVEPEVILDGDHSIEDSYKATVRVLQIVFEELENEGVYLPGMILKTSMILSGNKAANRASHEEVGFETLVGLLKSVPSETGAIVFLSGGQGDDEVNENLNAVSLARMNRFEEAKQAAARELFHDGDIAGYNRVRGLNEAPWEVSYSFGRGLQRKALLASGQDMENFEAGQEAQLQSALQTQAARLGKLDQHKLKQNLSVETITVNKVISTGNKETIRVDITLNDGSKGHFVVPAGTSDGQHERKTVGVARAIENVTKIHEAVLEAGIKPDQLVEIGQLMLEMDREGEIGAEATLAYQMANAWAVARSKFGFDGNLHQLVYWLISGGQTQPKGALRTRIQYNITNGGEHGENDLDMQEFMVVPIGNNIAENNQMADAIDEKLGLIYQELGLDADPYDGGESSLRGLEGGYTIPNFTTEKLAEIYADAESYDIPGLDLVALRDEGVGIHEFILHALKAASEGVGFPVNLSREAGTTGLAMDIAATEMTIREADGKTPKLADGKFQYSFEGKTYDSDAFTTILADWTHKFPIDSIEDAADEDDWNGTIAFIQKMHERTMYIGDDSLVTQAGRLELFVEKLREAGLIGEDGRVTKRIGILIKLNQNGFLVTGNTESSDDPVSGYLGTLEVIQLAAKYGIEAIVSHRSKEATAEDNEVSIADVAAGADISGRGAYGLKSGDHVNPHRGIKEDRLDDIDANQVAPSIAERAHQAALRNIVSRMVPVDGGILAADESVGSAANRLNMVGMENTAENREKMRQLMLTVERQREAGISAVILDQDTYGNVDQDGNNLIDTHVIGKGKVAGIKTDKKIIDDPDSPGEKIPNPEGLEALPEMLAVHKAMGAEFTKWRTVHYIDPERDFPTEANIRKNAIVQAKQAKMTQDAGMVPIVEPEVILDGDHSIEDSYKATIRVLQIVFEELANEGVYLPGMILKTSMILSGNKADNRASHEEVGFETLVGLLKSVPSETGAIVFLSGGQGDDEVNENLNEISLARLNRFEEARERAASELAIEGNIVGAQKLNRLNEAPWEVSYSFGRGLQRPALKKAGRNMRNFKAGQQVQLQSALTTQAARLGELHPQREVDREALRSIVTRMVPADGGIMAADESVGSAANRLNMVGMENTAENREKMRQLMLTVPGQVHAGITAVILDQDTYGNVDQEGRNLIDTHVIAEGKVAGIKTDKKLIDDPDSPGEKVPNPEGLEALPEMLRAHKAMGAEFTKWRTVHYIDVEKDFPSEENIRKNAIVQAKQAKMTQEAGMVPIVEPEVILDGDHSIEDSYKATVRVLQIVFEELENEGVYLPGMILKTSMILSGNKAANRASHEEVGFETLVGLLKSVPSETGAIVFLSGGQGDDEVNENLNAVSLARMNRFEEAKQAAARELFHDGDIAGYNRVRGLNEAPWEVSYSFGRGLQRKALLASGQDMENFEAGQEAQLQSALQTQAARLGQLHPEGSKPHESPVGFEALPSLEPLDFIEEGKAPTPIDASPTSLEEIRDINVHVHDWVQEVVGFVKPDQLEVLTENDEERLIDEAVEAGELFKTRDGNYFARSNEKDVARSVSRTFIATDDPADAGIFTNWIHTDEIRRRADELMEGAAEGETLYLVPHLVGVPGSPIQKVVMQLTTSRYVAISTYKMSRVGKPAWESLGDSDDFIRGRQFPGDLDNLDRSEDHEKDERVFVVYPKENKIDSFGSNYGGNVLLGKKFVALRQMMYDGVKNGTLAEHMLLLEMENLKTGEKDIIAAAFPSMSGKTTTAFLNSTNPDLRFRVIGDDIVGMWPTKDGLYAVNPEYGFFGVIPGVNEIENRHFLNAVGPNMGAVLTNVAWNPKTQEVWWEGKAPRNPSMSNPAYPSLEGNGQYWEDWRGNKIVDRSSEWQIPLPGQKLSEDDEKKFHWAHPNSRATTTIGNVETASKSYSDPRGVKVDAIIYGGRIDELEPTVRMLPNAVQGILDGMMMIVQKTAAEDSTGGPLYREDSYAQRPFYSIKLLQHVMQQLRVLKTVGDNGPKYFHINLFKKLKDGKPGTPGFDETTRIMEWISDAIRGKAKGVNTPLGFIPTKDALRMEGFNNRDGTPVTEEQLEEAFSYDPALFVQEMQRQRAFLKKVIYEEYIKFGLEIPQDLREVLNLFFALLEEKESQFRREARRVDNDAGEKITADQFILETSMLLSA